jgi:hypothetical protein
MKYSGSDFKFTSQANHLAKLLTLKAENHRENIHLQRLYKRRKVAEDGHVMSNWHILNQSAINEHRTPQISGLPVQPIYVPVEGEDGGGEGETTVVEAEWEPI